jgi:phosphoserine/homoserine phosphotransferase
MHKKPVLLAMDLEGVLVPEIWIAVSEHTDIPELRLTTRDLPDYDKLMKRRLSILDEHHLTLQDIQEVIKEVAPFPGAHAFLKRARSVLQVIVLSDTYYEFARPLMEKLEYPTLFCNSLEIDEHGRIVNYHLRQKDGKRRAVVAFQRLDFEVIAIGDSYNDTTMLAAAEMGILFRPPDNVKKEFSHFSVCTDYVEVSRHIEGYLRKGRKT